MVWEYTVVHFSRTVGSFGRYGNPSWKTIILPIEAPITAPTLATFQKVANVGAVIGASVGKNIAFHEGLPYLPNDPTVLENWMTMYYNTTDDGPLQFPTLNISLVFIPE